MKLHKLFPLLLTAAMLFSLAACSRGNTETTSQQAAKGESTMPNTAPTEEARIDTQPKILVAYFSATGTTKGIAQQLATGLGADLYEIVPETPYTSADLNYNDHSSRSSLETDDPDARPAISGTVENMGQYDVVLIGYPIWWGNAPRIMNTFVESYDFSGKTLAAFCTSGSSGFGSSDSTLRAAADTALWLEGTRFSGSASSEEILKWANGLGIRDT